MATIKVTSDDLVSIAGQLNNAAAQINDISNQARGQVQQLQGEIWSGQAQAAFDQAFVTWEQGAKQVDDSLHKISTLLQQAGQRYAETEQGIAGTFQA